MFIRRAIFIAIAIFLFISATAANPDAIHNVLRDGHVLPFAPHSAFGAIVFDPLPTYPPTAPPNQEPRYPLWSPNPACKNDAAAPALIEADDPEQWNSVTSTWGGHDAVDLAHDVFSGAGLIDYYFLNKFPRSTHLYVGTIVSGASFKWASGDSHGIKNYELIGSAAATSFLQKYETAMGFTTEVAGTGSTPKPFYKRLIAQGELATGEIAVENISAPTAFFIYADDCAVECPSISFNAPDDGFHRRGYFPGAAMTINHDYNEGLLDTNGGFAYWDLGRPSPGPTPYPVTIDRCATPLPGTSKIDMNRAVDLNGWYGVPITITGTSKFMDQYWYLNPQFPAPFSASLWVNGFTDPATGLAVMPGTYTVPFPQPAVSPWVGDTDHAIALGFSKISAARSIIYVPSGGDFWPARFYYLDPVH